MNTQMIVGGFMNEWLKNNMVWLFDGLGAAIIISFIAWLFKRYVIIKRNDITNYKERIGLLSEENKKLNSKLSAYENNEKQFEDLQYDSQDEVYYKIEKGIKTYYCPRCKDVNLKLVYLDKYPDTIGNVFICKNCNKPFGKGCFPTEDSSYNDIFGYLE